MPYIPTEAVDSSNIEAIGYHRQTQTLRIIFHGGRAYDYPMVPEQEYQRMVEAGSKGKFLNTRIKPMYAYRTPRPEELQEPCCEHSGPDPTCTDECFPCNEWCCPGPSPSAEVRGAITAGLRHGRRIVEGAQQSAAVDEVPPALPRTTEGEVDYAAIPDATHLFEEADKACLHANKESNADGSYVVCAACGVDLTAQGPDASSCPHGADGRDCAEDCPCTTCHRSDMGVKAPGGGEEVEDGQ